MDIKPVHKQQFIGDASKHIAKKIPVASTIAAASVAPLPISFETPLAARHKLRQMLPSLRDMILMVIALTIATVIVLARVPIAKALSAVYLSVSKEIVLTIHPLPSINVNERRVSTQQNLNREIASLTHQSINVSLAGTKIKPTLSEIRSWINVSPEKYGYYELSVSTRSVTNYIDKQIKSLTKAPIDQVVVSLSNGNNSTLQTGSNGLKFPTPGNLVKQISSQLIKGNGVNGQLPGISVPFSTLSHPTNNKLIEVNVTTKRMYAYDDGILIRTFLVSAGAPGTPTPLGTFHIWDKLVSQNMYAYLPNGHLEYYQPDVQWVNYFDHSGDAIHGNYWRPLSYFGKINSSHGCVGVINSDAEWIYNWAPIGTTVIIHA